MPMERNVLAIGLCEAIDRAGFEPEKYDVGGKKCVSFTVRGAPFRIATVIFQISVAMVDMDRDDLIRELAGGQVGLPQGESFPLSIAAIGDSLVFVDVPWSVECQDKYGAPEDSPEGCPGCGCDPGDGLTAGCDAEDGCGYWRHVGALHDRA